MVESGGASGGAPTTGEGWSPWSASERESFFAAIDRNRRASWQITGVCAAAIAVLTAVVAVLLSPLLLGAVGLALDLVNLVVPMPDMLGAVGHRLDVVLDDKTFTVRGLVQVTALAALPGFVVIGLMVFALQRALARSPLFSGGESFGRAPGAALVEQRLRNVVEEMAIAAAIPVPQIRIVPGGANAAVFGSDPAHAAILVGEGLLTGLNRAEMQAAMAHLIGSIAGGDVPIGMRAALTFSLFGLMARISACFGDRREIYRVATILRTLAWPTRAGTERMIAEMADPFGTPADVVVADGAVEARAPGRDGRKTSSAHDLTWREWLMIPLLGPVVMSGFLGGMVSEFFLRPLVSLAWRRRKYMADAAAVRLTRDPDATAAMLRTVATTTGAGLQSWAAHMAIAGAGGAPAGLLAGGILSIFPPLERRQRALGRMGATLAATAKPSRTRPTPLMVLIGVLGVVAGGLMGLVVVLLTWLSFALSGIFTIIPLAILHALLRAL